MNKISKFILIFLPSLFFGCLAVTMGKDTNWDLQNYHFYNGYAFLHNLTLSYKNILPAGIGTYLDPICNTFNFLLIDNLPPKAVGFAIGFLQGFIFTIIFIIAYYFLKFEKKYIRIFGSALSAGLAMYAPDALSELGNTMGDTLLGVFVLLSVYLILISDNNNGKKSINIIYSELFLAGLFTGISSGLKYTNMVYAIAILFSLAMARFFKKDFLRKYFFILAGMFIGFISVFGLWALELYKMFGNPVFPFMNGIFHSRYYPQISFKDGRWVPKNIVEWIFLPFFFNGNPNFKDMEINFTYYSFAIIYVLAVVILFKKIGNIFFYKNSDNTDNSKEILSSGENWLIIFFVSSFIIWEFMFSYYRYIAPLEALAPVVIFILLGKLFKKKILLYISYIIIAFFIVVTVRTQNWGRQPWNTSKTYFGVKLPPVPPKSLVLLDFQPSAFLIPFFPVDARFILINSPPFSYDPFMKIKFWKKLTENTISGHKGPIFAILIKQGIVNNLLKLKKYDLTLKSSCINIKNDINPDIVMCPLKRICLYDKDKKTDSGIP